MNFRDFIIGISKNSCLLCVGAAWILAQIIKGFTGYYKDGAFSLRTFFCGTGGMPSSHSATVMALVTSAAITYGADSFAFAVSVLLAIIVMSDATGVRYETGKQAKVLNRLIKEFLEETPENQEEKLKELIGHTRFQVLVGAILGVVVALLISALLKA